MAEGIQDNPLLKNESLAELKPFHGYSVSNNYDDDDSGCYFEIDNCWITSKTEKVKVFIRRPKQKDNKTQNSALNPFLYLIFAEDDNKNKIARMKEIIDFAKKKQVPCHIVGQKVFFHIGATKTACIHETTDKNTFDELLKKGFQEFDLLEGELSDEINSFKTRAAAVIRTEFVPVIISLGRNGPTQDEVITSAKTLQIPIIHFKKRNQTNIQDLHVLWAMKGDGIGEEGITAFKTVPVTDMPLRIKTMNEKYKPSSPGSDGIEDISEIHGDIDVLSCDVIVRVCLEEIPKTEEICDDYRTALSMYLLKNGEWSIPKKCMTENFSQKALDYIYGEVFDYKCMKKVWLNQISFSKIEYPLPDHKEDQIGSRTDSKNQTSEKEPLMNSCGTYGNTLTNWESECYGLIFFALLQNQHWDGALQLLATGYVGIHHILVGCVIVEDEINKGKAEKLLKEKLKPLTDKAVSITSYIYEADKEYKPKKEKTEKHTSTDCFAEKKLNHAERLLLNHGYLRDAINTENVAYLESGPVKKILKKTFYGKEEVNRQTTLCFLALAAVHMIVLPLLMINMEARPLHWFFKKYKLHYMKVYIHMLGFLSLLIAYANMLLFDYRVDGITGTDYFIMLWMASFFVDETNQIIVAVIRGKWKKYSIDWWNLLDWLMIALYTTGMILKTGEGSGFQITSKLFLVVTFTALCTRLLHLTCMTEFLGRKMVINRKMIKDTSAFMIIITIIMLWYSVSFYALLYPNSDFSWKQMEKILRNGYWMLFGDLNIDATDLECTHNKTIYDRGILQRCPSDLGVYVTPYLKAFYGLLAVVLLLNLLIAMYSDTYTKVQQNANLSWLQMQIDLFEEYRIKTVFPIHLQLLALPGSILAILWFCYSFLRNKYKSRQPGTSETTDTPKIDDHPMFVRVLLYDTNYDIRSPDTDEAEKEGVFRACEDEGKIDLSDSDAITTLNRLKTIEDSLQNMREKEDTRNREVMQLLKEIAKKFHSDKKEEQSLKEKKIPEEEIQNTEF
ncbi:unnamed protein product [Mytilus edulis]|uniref:Ion transport domain-containing protein n=1 Tax=Mytilus edulis TaxID=6550 RepID=A0A8S3VRA8_MYTED|nr:unnamed protein product [Mytilus edulis]